MGLAAALTGAAERGQYRIAVPEVGITAIVAPNVTLVGATRFLGLSAEIMEAWKTDASGDGAELLLEAAGRSCYQSWHNPAGRTNHEYIASIIRQGHGSVLEHADYSLYLRGVSRALTHELVRHRAGCSYSQLSQRYVDSSDIAFVVPPALMGDDSLLEVWAEACRASLAAYVRLVEGLDERIADRKRKRECARAVLPNCAETHIVMTANVRAWRHILALRGSEHADAEIRRLMAVILGVLSDTVPLFRDYVTEAGSDGVPVVRVVAEE